MYWVDTQGSLSNRGCYDGYQQIAFEYVWRTGGIAKEADYPYIGASGFCNTTTPLTKLSNVSPESGAPCALLCLPSKIIPAGVCFYHPSRGRFYVRDVGQDHVCKGWGEWPHGSPDHQGTHDRCLMPLWWTPLLAGCRLIIISCL